MQPEENNPDPTIQPTATQNPQPSSYSERTIQPLSPDMNLQDVATVASNIITPPVAPTPLASDTLVDGSNQSPIYVAEQPITETASFKADLPPIVDNTNTHKNHWRKSAIIIVSLILLAIGGYVIYVRYNPTSPVAFIGDKATNLIKGTNDNTVKESDLIVQKDTNIEYLRPKSWVLINGIAGGYKSKSGDTDTTINYAMAYISDVDTRLINLPEDQLELQRLHPTSSSLFDTTAKDFLQRAGRKCSTKVKFNSIADSNVMGNARGVYVNEASCETSEGTVLLKERTALRDDGRLLFTMIIAPENDWTNNADAYQKILNSVE